ncbi:MAG TPA: biopolymer transporter ExbD [Terracidiphilus sp.]|jgi:biopolymer transport protein ExbD|nr:biopolymer transporter ExbD [Terracidiphilus sp.]
MQSEINVTPMIDVLLVLLIIFMVIVPLVPRGEAVLAPRPAAGSKGQQDAVVLEVLKGRPGEPVFRINQQPVSRQDLPARLAAIYANRADRVLFIKGDDQVSFAEVAQAIDIGHAAGIDRVGIITPGGQSGL